MTYKFDLILGRFLCLDAAVPLVKTTKMVDGSYEVTWDRAAHVTSVVWCFGACFEDDSSLVNCRVGLLKCDSNKFHLNLDKRIRT